MWYVPHHSFFYWLCPCTLYLSAIVSLANLNTLFGHNLLISYLYYYRSWNKYDKHSQFKMNIWKSLNVIIHEITFYKRKILFLCAWVMTQGLELLWLKKIQKKIMGSYWYWTGSWVWVYELQHVYSMHVTFVEIIDLFGKFKFRCN